MVEKSSNIEADKELMSTENTHQKFSIVLPVRNGGEHVKQCVQSILQQSCGDFNLLILENCSTDGTFEWLQTLNDKRIKIFPSDHPLSLEDNWSRISIIDRNEYMTVIGHDDLLAPDYLEVIIELIKRHPNATLYQTHFKYIDASGNFLRHCLPMCEARKVHEFVAQQLMRTLNSTGTGYMMRSADFDDIGGFPRYPNLIFADWELWTKLTERGYLATDQSECFSYREHSSASTCTTVFEHQSCLTRYMLFLEKEAQKNQQLSTIINRYCASYFDFMFKELIYLSLRNKTGKGRKNKMEIAEEFQKLGEKMMPADKYFINKSHQLQIAIFVNNWLIGRSILRLIMKISECLTSLLQRNKYTIK